MTGTSPSPSRISRSSRLAPRNGARLYRSNLQPRLRHSPIFTSTPRARAALAMTAGSADPTSGGAGDFAARTAANSGNDDSALHSALPAAWTSVWPLARPSRIQVLIWSDVTGPYSFRSAPMILYMTAVLGSP